MCHIYNGDHFTTLKWTIVKAHLDLCQTYWGQKFAAERGNVKVGLIWGHKLLFFTAEDVAIAVLSTKSLETRLIDREHCCPECFCCSLRNMSAAPKKEIAKYKSLKIAKSECTFQMFKEKFQNLHSKFLWALNSDSSNKSIKGSNHFAKCGSEMYAHVPNKNNFDRF